jgi:hypothetical protein
MRGKLIISIMMVLFLGLAACSQDSNTQGDRESDVASETDQGEKEPVVTDQEESDSGNEESDVTDKDDEQDKNDNKQYENEVFKEVSVATVEDGSIVVKGKARVFEGVFQYAVISGTEILMENHYQTDGAPAWGSFEITIDKELLKKEEVSFELFVYSAKDGSKTDTLTIPIK